MADLESADFENPNPSIHDLFEYYNQIYFEGKLGPCTLQWSSKRMTLCAGVCQYSTYGGCEIRLSEPLLKYRPVSDLKNTLLHEMIHAYLFLTNGNKDHDDHGPCFQHMMMMINDFNLVDEERPQDGYQVTIYHNFTNEVDLYRTHHWRCMNCSDLIKRAMNRTPSASDCLIRSDTCSHPRCHWHMHQRSCGGSYEKIHEPAGYVDKRKKAATPALADGSNGNDLSGGREDAHLAGNGQKRKMGSNGGTSKKGNKEPPVQVKSASLDNYFTPIRKDEGKNFHAQTITVEEGNSSETSFEGENLSSGEMNGKRKFLMLNETSQKESRSDSMEESKGMTLRSQSFSTRKEVEETLVSKVASTQLEDSSSSKAAAADDDTRKSLGGTPSTPSQAKGTPTSKGSRKNGAGKETLGTSGDSPSRKKYKKVDELLKQQTSKEPLVILAWANWVTYESDEENEEPLINRRTKRRKQVLISNVLKKGKTILDSSQDTELVPAEESQTASEIPMETDCKHPLEETVQKVDNNGGKQSPQKITITDNKQIFIELSDDEQLPEATGKIIDCSKGDSPKQTFAAVRDFDRQDLSQSTLTSATQGGRHESNTTTDMMTCPICNVIFRDNERNTVVNKHIDECLARCSSLS
ncbi:unnamed protein product [Calypogeia fissa]